MSNIAKAFEAIRSEHRGGFIPFISAGDPDPQMCLGILGILAKCGADIIELGVPFSDPMADGPTIQASSQRALESGTDLPTILEIVREFRNRSDIPIVLFSYLNPLLAYGLSEIAADAADAGADAVLVTDAIDGEAARLADEFRKHNLDFISLIAPTTTDARLQTICSISSGFIYAVSRTGVTGARIESATAAEDLVRRARLYTDLPIAVGFGISTPEQICDVWRYADAAVVGSAIVAEIERSAGLKDLPARVENFVRNLVPKGCK
jgi:tryptophan synthase alpha chain